VGIGFVLVGYLFCLDLFNVYTLLPAAALMYLGLSKLARFNRPLKTAKYLTIPTGIVGAVGCILLLLRTFLPGFGAADAVSRWLSLCGDVCLAALLFSVLGGMALLCAEVGLPKQRASAVSCQVYTLLYYLPAAALECIEVPEGAAVNRFLAIFATVWLLLGLVVFALTAKCLHACYRMITMPEQYDTPDDTEGGDTPPEAPGASAPDDPAGADAPPTAQNTAESGKDTKAGPDKKH